MEMSNEKGIYYGLYYQKLYDCILKNPDEFTCLVQEYSIIIDEIKIKSYDDYDYLIQKNFLNDLYHNVLNDAYKNGDIDKAAYEVWKNLTDDDPFPPLQEE